MKAEIKVPAVGESITEATIADWAKKSGDRVHRDDVLLTLETDKASVEVVAENEGVLEIKANPGDVVKIGAVVGYIDSEAQATSSAPPTKNETNKAAPPAKAEAASSPSPSPQAKSSNGNGGTNEVVLSPAVRRVVSENQLDPTQIPGTGRGGRITKADALSAVGQNPAAVAAPAAPSPAAPAKSTEIPPLPPSRTLATGEETRREPLSALRKTIARRLVEAQHTAAILTTFNEIDMSAVMAIREKYKERFKERHNINLGFMGFFVKAVCEGLKAFPRLNAMIEGDSIVYFNYVNMGIAVSTDKGLLVPALRRADQMSLSEVEQAIRHFAAKARDNKISIDDLSGGTFTITNGGVFGSMMSTPILNPPQSGILGLHKIQDRPVAIQGKVEIRPMMYVALSYDHRLVDGRESVSFLVRVKECMEDPARLLLEI